jgi:hypothetical protein
LTAARSGKRPIHELAGIYSASFMKGEKTVFPELEPGSGITDIRIGSISISKNSSISEAGKLTGARRYALPSSATNSFARACNFNLHGFVERRGGEPVPETEQALSAAWQYFGRHNPARSPLTIG